MRPPTCFRAVQSYSASERGLSLPRPWCTLKPANRALVARDLWQDAGWAESCLRNQRTSKFGHLTSHNTGVLSAKMARNSARTPRCVSSGIPSTEPSSAPVMPSRAPEEETVADRERSSSSVGTTK